MYKEMDWNPAEWFTGCSLSDEILLRPSKLTAFGLSVALGILRIVRQSGAPERSRGSRPKACAKWIRLSVILSVVVKGDLILSLVILLKVRCVAGTVLVRSSVVLILRVDLLIWIVCRVVVLSCDRISKRSCLCQQAGRGLTVLILVILRPVIVAIALLAEEEIHVRVVVEDKQADLL